MISYDAVFEQSSPYSPVVFILSPGSDPVSDLMKLAERKGFGGDRLKLLAMGQGQEKVTSVGVIAVCSNYRSCSCCCGAVHISLPKVCSALKA